MESTKVSILDRIFDVYGIPGEGWFEILKSKKRFDGQNGFNLASLKTMIGPDAVCLDVGANYGIFSLAMAQLANYVWAFEPDPKCVEVLKQTLHAVDNVTLLPWIVGKQNKSGTFVEETKWRSSSHFIPGSGGNTSHSIDSMQLQRVDLIKIDAEGSELDIIEGARQTLAAFRPKVIMEFNCFAFENYRNIEPRDALAFIKSVFPRVQYFRKGVPVELGTNFLEVNCDVLVNDLLCSWE